MYSRVPFTEDLMSVLERVLDKSIVVGSSAAVGVAGCDLAALNLTCSVASSSIHSGYGQRWNDDREPELFPFWRRDLWTK